MLYHHQNDSALSSCPIIRLSYWATNTEYCLPSSIKASSFQVIFCVRVLLILFHWQTPLLSLPPPRPIMDYAFSRERNFPSKDKHFFFVFMNWTDVFWKKSIDFEKGMSGPRNGPLQCQLAEFVSPLACMHAVFISILLQSSPSLALSVLHASAQFFSVVAFAFLFVTNFNIIFSLSLVRLHAGSLLLEFLPCSVSHTA